MSDSSTEETQMDDDDSFNCDYCGEENGTVDMVRTCTVCRIESEFCKECSPSLCYGEECHSAKPVCMVCMRYISKGLEERRSFDIDPRDDESLIKCHICERKSNRLMKCVLCEHKDGHCDRCVIYKCRKMAKDECEVCLNCALEIKDYLEDNP
jgi:hypothetical protein